MLVRVMTWNICTGRNWKKIVQLIEAKRAEIIGLQEVDNSFRESTEGVDVCKNIGRALGYYCAYCPSIEIADKTKTRQYGNCIVSRFPILKSQKHFLSPEIPWNQKSFETEPRTLLETRIKIGKTIVRFMTTHLAYSHKFQTSQIKLRQIRTVLNLIESNKQYPSILCGDFNSLPESQEIKEIEKHLINVGKNSMNWTTYRNVSQANLEGTQGKIDYIFLSPEIKHKDLEIPETHLSDHLPVLVAVDL